MDIISAARDIMTVVMENLTPPAQPSTNTTAPTQTPADAAPATGFLDVPIELQLRMLSFLPAKQIQRSRRINKHFNNIIDDREHRSLLIAPGVSRSLARIQQSVEYFCSPKEDADLLECLSRVVRGRGLPDTRNNEILADIHALPRWTADIYLSRYPDMQNPDDEIAEIEHRNAVEDQMELIADRMILVHLENHVPMESSHYSHDHRHTHYEFSYWHPRAHCGYVDPPDLELDGFINGLDMDLLEAYGINEEVLESWYYALVYTPNGRLQGPSYPLNYPPEVPSAEQILTRTSAWRYKPQGQVHAHQTSRSGLGLVAEEEECHFVSDELEDALGIPSIREDDDWAPPFGYCVQPGWTTEKIRAVLEGNIQAQKGVPSELAKAALLEDIFLF